MNNVMSLITGLVFGLGLIVSGMTNPAKVLAFLDLAGMWDPSLALVMGGAIPISAIAFFLAGKRGTSLLGRTINLPSTRTINWKLTTGSMLFGIGWGLAGICPGPAIALLGYGLQKSFIFIAAMFAGMALFGRLTAKRK